MAQKVIQIGSSLGVTLSQDVLAELGVHKGDAVRVAVNADSQKIEIIPMRLEAYAKQLADAKRLVEEHSDELSKLQGE